MDEKVVRLGEHLPLSTRRVVTFFGEAASFETPIGMVEGLADGAILVRNFEDDTQYEVTAAQAHEIAKAFSHAAVAVEQWQERASGFNRIRVTRTTSGEVTVTWRGRTRPMRLSKLRGYRSLRGVPSGDSTGRRWKHDGFTRPCGECRVCPSELYVAADDVRVNDIRVPHVEVCPACIDKLANIPETLAAVLPMEGAAEPGDGR